MHAGVARIGRDPVNLRNRVVASSAGLHRLHVDNPVADHLTGASEILLRELVDRPGSVLVARVFAIEENAFGHSDMLAAKWLSKNRKTKDLLNC